MKPTLERAAKALAPVLAVAVVLLASYFAPVKVSGLNLTACGYTSPIPTVTNVNPNKGTTAGGTTVTITGTQFCNGPVTVMFGTIAATGVVVVSNTQITAVSPAQGAGPVHVTVTTAGGTSATSAADVFTYVAPGHCPVGSVSFSAAPPSPSSVGTTVTITAVAVGCPTYALYQFWILFPGATSYTLVQAYSTSATFSWNTSGLAAGTYSISVWARDASVSVGAFSNSAGSWDAYSNGTYTLTSTPCTGLTVTSSPSGTAPVGTTVTFTATATGCPNPLYQFWIMEPGSGTWTLVQAYSTSKVFIWVTTSMPAGTFGISVWARDASSSGTSSNASGSWDVFNSSTYVLTTTHPPCTGVSVVASPSGTALAGTTVTFTATASGCPNPSPVFQFWILAPGASSWTLVQGYSTSAVFSWNTTGLIAGTYGVSVRVRDAMSPGIAGNSSGTWDAYSSITYVLTTTPCASVSVTSSPSGTAAAGTTVTFTATGMGCPHASPLFEFWILAPGASSWTLVQAYSTTNTFTWVTTGKPAGSYGISVRIRDAQSTGTAGNGSGTWDAYNSSTYVLT